MALDGDAGTLDPAFEAHTLTLKHYAQAWWEGWFPESVLRDTFSDAAIRLSRCNGSPWHSVNGPMTALVASMQRIGWSFPSAAEVVDDTGTSWWFARDSPTAIVGACREAVRRWRLERIGKLLPGLIPEYCDVGAPICERTVLVDFTTFISPLLSGRPPRACLEMGWSNIWKGDFASALSGGQWTQARKAQVEAFNISDTRCQLCLSEVGTVAHRFCCKRTLPASGWPAPPKAAELIFARLSGTRKRYLQERGLLVVRVPAPPSQGEGSFSWLVQPRETAELENAVWYFDGSLQHGKWRLFRSTGFGIIVVSHTGTLLGYGKGTPPHWCRTAAAAEAWALQVILAHCPFPPEMRTDCLSLLRTAEQDTQKAVNAKRQLARIWVAISSHLDCRISVLCKDGVLTWMPAHQSLGMIGETRRSDGKRLTVLDWRANRLVDGLAKQEARERLMPSAVEKLLESGVAAVRHAAVQLGRVTHAANNHPSHEVGPDGQQVTKLLRDATQAAKTYKRKATELLAQPVKKVGPKPCTAKAWAETGKVARRPNPKTLHDARVRGYQAACTKRRVEAIGSALKPSASTASTASKREAFEERVRSRFQGT